MVGMLDYHFHYAVMAADDRVREAMGQRRSRRPLRPQRRPREGYGQPEKRG